MRPRNYGQIARGKRTLRDLRPHLRKLEFAAVQGEGVQLASVAECRRFQLESRFRLMAELLPDDPLSQSIVAEELAMLAKEMEAV